MDRWGDSAPEPRRAGTAGHPMDEWWAAHAWDQHVPLQPGPGVWDERAAAV